MKKEIMKKESLLYKINLFLRSLLFSCLSLLLIFIYSFICVACAPMPLKYRYKIVISCIALTLWLLKIICRVRYQVTGLENIPRDRNGIILSKHQSIWETYFLPQIFYQPAIILKRELLWVPFFGWGLATVAPIAINRSNTTTAMQQIIAQGKKYLDAGRWILVFPEGTRIPYGKVGNYRLGGARLAVNTGYPVIPVAHNAGKFWGKRSFIKKPGTIQMIIGPLIETQGRKPEEVMAQVKEWIEDKVKEIDRSTEI